VAVVAVAVATVLVAPHAKKDTYPYCSWESIYISVVAGVKIYTLLCCTYNQNDNRYATYQTVQNAPNCIRRYEEDNT
jgi:hypothetical protein